MQPSVFLAMNLLLFYPIFLPAAHAAIERVNGDVIFSHTPEDWDTKWNAWPMLNLTRLAADRSNKTALSFEPDATPLEICTRAVGCLGTAAANAAGYAIVQAKALPAYCANLANTMSDMIGANNLALAKQVLAFALVEVALPLALTVPMYYINAKLQNAAPQSKDDACGVSQAQEIAEQAGTATYGYCLQLQQVTSDKAFSRIDYGTVSSDNTNDDVGLDFKMRMLISTDKGKYLQACSLLGVELKRSSNLNLWI